MYIYTICIYIQTEHTTVTTRQRLSLRSLLLWFFYVVNQSCAWNLEAHVDVLGNTHVAVYESNLLSQGEAAHYTNIMEGELIRATSKCSLNVDQAFIAEDADPNVYT